MLNEDLKLTILYESDSECFAQSLVLDTEHSVNRISYARLLSNKGRISGHTEEKKRARGLLSEILRHCDDDDDLRKTIEQRISIRQHNLKQPFFAICCDSEVRLALITNTLPTINEYQLMDPSTSMYSHAQRYMHIVLHDMKKFLSSPGEELIQMYDKKNYPRGIYPRSCFYTTEYKRYSIWGFIFNRNGKFLMHRRSATTKDGRNLWDKSVGGHVDLRDGSSVVTTQREMIEELFLPRLNTPNIYKHI